MEKISFKRGGWFPVPTRILFENNQEMLVQQGSLFSFPKSITKFRSMLFLQYRKENFPGPSTVIPGMPKLSASDFLKRQCFIIVEERSII